MKRERKRLGELLVEAGAITTEQLDDALAGQKKSGLKLGQYLIQSGTLKENIIIDSVSRPLRKARASKFASSLKARKFLPDVGEGTPVIVGASSCEHYPGRAHRGCRWFEQGAVTRSILRKHPPLSSVNH